MLLYCTTKHVKAMTICYIHHQTFKTSFFLLLTILSHLNNVHSISNFDKTRICCKYV